MKNNYDIIVVGGGHAGCEAAAVAVKAQEQGLARIPITYEEELENAKRIIKRSRDITRMMMEEHFIAEPPVAEAEQHPEVEPVH